MGFDHTFPVPFTYASSSGQHPVFAKPWFELGNRRCVYGSQMCTGLSALCPEASKSGLGRSAWGRQREDILGWRVGGGWTRGVGTIKPTTRYILTLILTD